MSGDERRCANCDERLTGPYCAACGQRDRDVRRGIGALLAEAIAEALELDGRLPRTLGPFLLRPGFLVQEFVAGRRRRYTSPVRLLVFALFVSFLVFGWAANRTYDRVEEALAAAPEPFAETPAAAAAPAPDGVGVRFSSDGGLQVDLSEGGAEDDRFRRLAALPKHEVVRLVLEQWLGLLPIAVVIVLVPALALVLELCFPRYLVVEHLLLSVHVHVVGLLLLTGAVLVGHETVAGIALAAPFVYLALAVRRLYPQAWWRQVLKLAVIGAGHGVVLVVTVGGALVWGLFRL